ncbi:hypothetical protein [Rhodocista pekingensis]|uniref:Uncharacterized protein n=1 Tax=Rhodocista pekingensis TaxID=201185 RepID=A0ABW2KWF8_9PROT
MFKAIFAALAPVVSNDWVIGSVLVGLCAWAIWSGTRFIRATLRFRKALAGARATVRQSSDAVSFAERYGEIDTALAEDPVLGERWCEFRNSLLLPRQAGQPVRTTVRPKTWFDVGLLHSMPGGINLRYHTAMPNLLVGAGLLFTFLGLAAALGSAGGIVAGTAEIRNEALRLLLGTASAKFVTSLVGMGLSITYAITSKVLLKRVEDDLAGFLSALEARIPLITPADLQRETNDLLERQTDRIEAVSAELAAGLGSAFDRALDARLGDHLGPLTQAMQQLTLGLGSHNEQAMASMLDSFLQGLRGGTGEHMQQVVDSLSGLGTRLEGVQQGLGEAAVRMTQSADTVANRLGAGTEAALARITDQMGGLAETLGRIAEQSRTTGAEAGERMAARIEAAAAGFEESARNVATLLERTAAAVEGSMGRQTEETAARLAERVEAMTAELSALAASSRTAGIDAFDQLASRVTEASSALERSVGRIGTLLERSASEGGDALGRGAEKAVTRISDATEGMRAEIQAMLAELRASVGTAGEALRTSGAEGAAAFRDGLGDAGGSIAAAVRDAADRLGRAGTEAADALGRGGETAGTAMRSAGGLLGDKVGALTHEITALAAAANALATRSTEFERAAGAAAGPLLQASTNLTAAGQTVRGTTESLGTVVQAVGRAIEQVSEASGRLDAATAAAGRLADGLATAAKRFEGIDGDLARTLTALQDGLQGFAREINGFVSQTDQNLAKAATQIAALVKGLEETLEDFSADQNR